MADSVVGALRVLLGLDTAAFSSGLKDAQKDLTLFGQSFSQLASKLAITAAATKFVYDIKSMIDVADQMGKASQKWGIPVEHLSSLNFAAKMADVSFEQLGKGLGKLSKIMVEAAIDPSGEAANKFKALGVAVTDAGGNVRSTESVFKDIAERFSVAEDGAAKTAAAIKIFGKAGAELIPMLNLGRSGIQSFQDEAKKLGIVIGADVAGKAELFNDTLKRIHSAHDAIILQLTAEMLPGLQKLADMWIANAHQGSTFSEVAKGVGEAMVILAGQLQATMIMFENFGRIVGAVWNFLKSLTGTASQIADALDKMDAAVERNRQRWIEYAATVANLGKAGAFDSLEGLDKLIERVGKGMRNLPTDAKAGKSAIDSFIESQNKSIAAHRAEADALNLGIGAKERMKVLYQAEAIVQNENIVLTQKQIEAIKGLQAAAADAALVMFGEKMKQDAMSPLEVYRQKLQDVSDLLKAHPEYAKAAADYSVKAYVEMANAYATAAATALGGFSQLFMAFGAHNKKMFEVGKAFAIAEAIINTYKAANLALAQPPGPPFSLVYVAGAIAAGIANVMKITQQKAPTMALGGSFQLKGAGGVDSQMVPIMATPGERVTVDQNKYGEGGASNTITVAGINAKDYYRGDVLRDLVENLNQAIGDGLKIKMA